MIRSPLPAVRPGTSLSSLAQCGMQVSPDAMLDIQVKRIHEYKRQLLNILGIIHRYDAIRKMSPEERKQVRHSPLMCAVTCE